MSRPFLCVTPPGNLALATFFVVAIFACSLRPAVAQTSSTSDPKEDSDYRSAIKDALEEYDAGHFEEARILFRRAHEIEPNARTLRGIGMASFALRDYVAAVQALSAALMETRKALSPEQRTQVQELLERSRLFVDTYTLKPTPSDARVLIDGRPPEFESNGTVLLGLGAHSVEVSKPGFQLRTFSVNVRGGERKEMVMTLERKLPPLARLENASAEVGPQFGSSEPGRSSRSGRGWLIGAAAAALVGVGAGTYWVFEHDQLNACRNPVEGLRCNNQPAIETKRNIGIGATAVAGAAAVTMAVIGMLSGPSTKPAAHSSLSCAVFPSGVVCATLF